jgi:dihydrofolate reductase
MHNVVSVDGFIADENDDVGPLHDWYFNGDTPIIEGGDRSYDHSGFGGDFKVSKASAEYVRSMRGSIGASVMGRRLFDLVNGWEGHPPAGDHVVVVSHRPKPDGSARGDPGRRSAAPEVQGTPLNPRRGSSVTPGDGSRSRVASPGTHVITTM